MFCTVVKRYHILNLKWVEFICRYVIPSKKEIGTQFSIPYLDPLSYLCVWNILACWLGISVSQDIQQGSQEGGVVVREAGPLLHSPQKQAQDCFLFLGFVTWCNQLLHHLLSSSFTFPSIALTIFLHFEHKENIQLCEGSHHVHCY